LLDWGLNAYAGLVLVYLLVPIAIVILFSFNDTKSRFNFEWQGFTLKHWEDPGGPSGLLDSMRLSLEIGALSALAATALGTMMALALVRYRFRGRAPTNFVIFLPLAAPEVVLGASLLSLFLTVGIVTGYSTILIAHIMFSVSFVVVTMRSRLIGFDRSLEEAAQDLGANGLQTFRLVTFPLIAPGVVAAALLAFALSVDDFVITNFNAGDTVTFPVYIWGAARVSIPPQVNVMATIIFLMSVIFMLLTVWEQRHAQKVTQAQG
jgi:spermidine/putrescine transport system permease protein